MLWFRRYTIRMEIQSKIDEILKELNGGKITGTWMAIPGNHALTVVNFNGKEANFNPGSGIPLKVFINVKTGEIKIYHATVFLKDDNG